MAGKKSLLEAGSDNFWVTLTGFILVAASLFMIVYEAQGKFFVMCIGVTTILVGRVFQVGDFARFVSKSKPENAPPLGLTKGSVRAFLALGIFVVTAGYIYFIATGGTFKQEVLTFLGTLTTAVTSFYFGARSSESVAAAKPATADVSISGIKPAFVSAGAADITVTIQGRNLARVRDVELSDGTASIKAKKPIVPMDTEIVAVFDIPATPGLLEVVLLLPENGKLVSPTKLNVLEV